MVLPKSRHGHYKGVICSLGNSLGGALAGLLAKLSNIFNPFVLLMFSTLSMLLCLSAIMKKSDLADIFKVKTCSGKLAVIACLFFYPLSSTLGFLSIVYMEYADSYAIQQSNVVICSILAWLMLKEPLFWIDGLCLISTMTGILLVAKPEFIFGGYSESVDYSERWKGIVMAITGATLSSLFAVGRRKIVHLESSALGLFQALISICLSTTLAFTYKAEGMTPVFSCGSTLDKLFLALAGLCQGLGTISNLGVFQYLPAVYAMTLKTLGTVFSYLFQISFKLEPISWLSISGSCLIVASVIVKVLFLTLHLAKKRPRDQNIIFDSTADYTI